MRKPDGKYTFSTNNILDLNAEPGIYRYNGSPQGRPDGSSDYGLFIVLAAANDNYRLHLLCDGMHRLYYRFGTTNSDVNFCGWVQIATVQQ